MTSPGAPRLHPHDAGDMARAALPGPHPGLPLRGCPEHRGRRREHRGGGRRWPAPRGAHERGRRAGAGLLRQGRHPAHRDGCGAGAGLHRPGLFPGRRHEARRGAGRGGRPPGRGRAAGARAPRGRGGHRERGDGEHGRGHRGDHDQPGIDRAAPSPSEAAAPASTRWRSPAGSRTKVIIPESGGALGGRRDHVGSPRRLSRAALRRHRQLRCRRGQQDARGAPRPVPEIPGGPRDRDGGALDRHRRRGSLPASDLGDRRADPLPSLRARRPGGRGPRGLPSCPRGDLRLRGPRLGGGVRGVAGHGALPAPRQGARPARAREGLPGEAAVVLEGLLRRHRAGGARIALFDALRDRPQGPGHHRIPVRRWSTRRPVLRKRSGT